MNEDYALTPQGVNDPVKLHGVALGLFYAWRSRVVKVRGLDRFRAELDKMMDLHAYIRDIEARLSPQQLTVITPLDGGPKHGTNAELQRGGTRRADTGHRRRKGDSQH